MGYKKPSQMTNVEALPGLKSLWSKTLGDPRICIAVLDGPVDQFHPCFQGASLTQQQTLTSGTTDFGSTSQHGTHVASIILGQHNDLVPGVAPGCRGLIIPVFVEGREGSLIPCSQLDLARAITQAVEQNANVINISGGQFTLSGEPDPFLAHAIRLCEEKNVLIVAAAGNDGCDCLHVPASVASVLAVGAMDVLGNPISFSNWGKAYQDQGILALGENILGATPGDGTELMSGTSSATAIVSGIAALLLSIQLQQGNKPNPHAIRRAILKSALPCPSSPNFDRQRCLSGSLNIVAAYRLIKQGETKKMFDHKLSEEMIPSPDIGHQHPQTEFVTPSGTDGDCGCKGGRQIQLVYALGELGIDFGTQACQDSFTQAIPAGRSLLDYLDEEPYAASSLIWTLNLDATPIYAILPTGAYASVTYERLRSFLGDKQIERVAIPGYLAGNVKLLSGQVVPAIIPEVRGMYSWSTSALIEQLKLVAPTGSLEEKPQQKIREYLQRIYYEFRNLGVTPQDRALNFSATNAFQITDVMSAGASAEIGLDTITVEKSPVCRPDSDCYDVTLHFFNLQDSRRAGKVYRFAVDVSDVIPVSIGAVRSWSIAS